MVGGLITGRLTMYAIVGGGALAVLVVVGSYWYTRGTAGERAIWEMMTIDRTKEVREKNHELNKTTTRTNDERRIKEAEINARWNSYRQTPDSPERASQRQAPVESTASDAESEAPKLSWPELPPL